MKVVLVSFQDNVDVIGVKYLHAYLASKGHESSILLVPNTRPANVRAAISHIADQDPAVLGVSALTYEFDRARLFVEMLRNSISAPPIVFGGIHATADPEAGLAISDVVVRGEGEETLLELLPILEAGDPDRLESVAGVAFKRDGATVYTDVREPVEDLDALPYPRHLPEDMFVVDGGRVRSVKEPAIYRRYARYQGTFPSIITTRGCPYSCHYCCNSTFRSLYKTRLVRKRTPASVVDEMAQELQDFPGILYFHIQDDCFIMHPVEWLTEFCERYTKDVGIPFAAHSTPRHVTNEKLALLKKAGMRWFNMGLQSGSDRTNSEIYGRHVTAEDFLEAAAIVAELDLSPLYDVIVDNPYETDSDRLETIDVLLRIPRPYHLNIFSLDFFPGTELMRRAKEDGIPLPEAGSKSYTEPDPTPVNRLTRMSNALPRWLIRRLVRVIEAPAGKGAVKVFYYLSLAVEPFLYLRLVHRANDRSLLRTFRVLKSFSLTAFSKYFLRRQG